MSAISLKSITGITSITTPTGVDNQLTLHTNDTTQRVKVTQSGIEAVGVATFQDIDVDGHTNLDNVSIAGITTTTENIRIQGDNKYLTIGAGNDIGLVHTGSESFIANATGHLTHRSDVHKWENYAGSSEYLRILSGGAVVVAGTSAYSDGTFGEAKLQFNTKTGNHIGACSVADSTNSITHVLFKNPNGAIASVGTHGSDFIALTGNTERLRILSDGTIQYKTAGGKGYEFGASGSSASAAANVFAPASYTLAFGTNGNERLRINSDGDVLINTTTTPTADIKLLVSGNGGVSSGSYFSFRGDYGNVPEPAAYAIKYDSSLTNLSGAGGLHQYAYGGIAFNLGGQDRVNFKTTGEVGINTTVPSALLNVNTQSSGVTDAIVISRDVYGMVGKLTNSSGALVVTSNKQLILRSDPSAQFTAEGSLISFEIDGAEKVRIKNNSYVGIGTNNPGQILHLSASSGDVYNRVDTNVNGGLLIYVQGNQRSVFANDSAFSGTTTDTGIGALGNMIFRTGTSSYNERLRIKSDGKIQLSSATDNIIHTSSNSSRLRLFGGSNETVSNGAVLTLHGVSHSSGNYADLAAGSGGHIRFRVGTSEKLRIDSNGQVLIGTSTSSAYGNRQLAVGDTTDSSSFIEIRTSATGVGHLLFARTAEGNSGNYHGYIAYAQNTSAMTFHTNAGNERVRITSGGQLYVNTSATDTMFGVKNSGTFELITCRDTSNSLKFYVHHSGATYNSGGSYGSISDVSLKENIVDANSQWDDIKNIKVRNFNFKESTGQETYTQIGVIAQEIETVSPKLVSTPKDEIKTVKYSILYMKAVKALQEAMIRIEALETKVSALEGS